MTRFALHRNGFVSHASAGRDDVIRAKQLAAAGAYLGALGMYQSARGHFLESRANDSGLCMAACDAAISALTAKLAGEAVDLSPALTPDMGEVAARAKRLASLEAEHSAAELHAEKLRRNAAFNARNHKSELAFLDRILSVVDANSLLHIMAKQLETALRTGTCRGISKDPQWHVIVALARQSGIEL